MIHARQSGDAAPGDTVAVVKIIVPVVAGVAAVVVFSTLYRYRTPVNAKIRKWFGLSPADATSTVSGRAVTAEQLSTSAGTRPSTAAPRGGQAARGAAPPGRRRSRRLRRTESGNSVKTLPAYNKEAGDDELVLVRQRSATDMSDDELTDVEETSPDQNHNPYAPLARSASRHSNTSASDHGDTSQELELPPSIHPDEPQSAPSGSVLSRTRQSLTRRGWGESPTYLEAMSSPSFPPDVERLADIPPPRSPSGLMGFLSRVPTRFAPGSFRAPRSEEMRQLRPTSSHSLLLQPQSSRLSVMTTNSAHSVSAWSSNQSLVISSPVPNSAVRASFDSSDLPRAGLTGDQMKFLSSSEARNVAGVRVGDPARGRGRRPSSVASPRLSGEGHEPPPPSWDELDGERRRTEAEARVGLGKPVTREGGEENGGTGLSDQVGSSANASGSGVCEDEGEPGEGRAGGSGRGTAGTEEGERPTAEANQGPSAPQPTRPTVTTTTATTTPSSEAAMILTPPTPKKPKGLGLSINTDPIPTISATPLFALEPPTPSSSTIPGMSAR